MPIDTMTHPDFRRQGMHAALTTAVMDCIHSSEAPLSYVFPNDQSITHLITLRWTRAFQIPLLSKSIGPHEKTTLPKPFDVKEIDSFDDRVDILAASFKDRFRFSLKRDHHYLNWRYVSRPGEVYNVFVAMRHDALLGYMIFKYFGDDQGVTRSHVIDVLIRPEEEEAIGALIGAALKLALERKSETLSCWMLPHSPWYDHLLVHGFRAETTNRYMFARANSPAITETELSDATNWYVTMGDSDVF
jgi:hypothetical protein